MKVKEYLKGLNVTDYHRAICGFFETCASHLQKHKDTPPEHMSFTQNENGGFTAKIKSNDAEISFAQNRGGHSFITFEVDKVKYFEYVKAAYSKNLFSSRFEKGHPEHNLEECIETFFKFFGITSEDEMIEELKKNLVQKPIIADNSNSSNALENTPDTTSQAARPETAVKKPEVRNKKMPTLFAEV